ncbi:membrane protein [Kaistella jeonii]|uniref:Membrane protein n=2 Tax=Kaistella jeonii TaxID=266749 RepID=A0A0C1D457_9FLAO|nr:membrane protein [Kaistella jeonii]
MLVILLPVFSGFGQFFSKISGNLSEGIAINSIMGIFSISIVYSVLAFFIPLNIFVEGTFIILGLFFFFYFKIYNQFWSFIAENKRLFPLLSFIIIFFGSFYPFILDHFGYYVPTVKWISEVGLVQGISNLDLLLGQMSVWHILQAGFSNFADPFLRINVLVLIVYLIYILEKKSWIHLLFLPVLFLLSQSPSPDLPVIAFSLIILNEIINFNKNCALLFALSMFVFAIKPTITWLPIFAFSYSLLVLKSNFKFIFLGIFVLILFIFKNIWTFGFPVFPVQFLDLGLSWKPNPQLLQNSSEIAIMKTYDMQYQFAEIQKFSGFDYIKNWLFLSGIKGKIHLLFVLSLLVFFIYSLKKNSKLIWILFISILIKSILVLLFSAQYRFFLDVFFVIFFVLFNKLLTKKISILIFSVLSLFFAGFLSFPSMVKDLLPSFKLGNFLTGFTENQFYKPSHFELYKYKTHQIGNLKFNVVEKYPFSFDTPLPAISPQFIQEDLNAGIFPQLKGNTLKEGFIWRKISEKEKEDLRFILKDFK